MVLGRFLIKKVLDVLDNASASFAGVAVFFFIDTSLGLAKLDFGADV